MMNDKQIAMVKVANENFADAITTYLEHTSPVPPASSWTTFFNFFRYCITLKERTELIKTHLRTIQQAKLIVSLCDQIIELSTTKKND